MSEEDAKKFVEKVQSDSLFRKRIKEFLSSEGFSCTLSEIRKVEWDLMLMNYVSGLPASEHWD